MKSRFLLFSFPGLPHVHCAFGQKGAGNISLLAGDDAIAAREGLLRDLAPLGLEDFAEIRQVHGCEIVKIDEGSGLAPDPSSLREADGMISEAPGIGLMIKTADCQPILLAHKSGRQIMALHAGWRGNRADFPQIAVERFCAAYGLSPKDLLAARGPSLGPARAQFVNYEKEWPEKFRSFLDDNLCMDLWALTRAQLEAAGIPARQIYGIDICTMENAKQFFSWRGEKSPGRQASLVWRSAI